MEVVRFIDLFCGIGGFRQAMIEACREHDLIPDCVFSSDIDLACQFSYEENFGDRPFGDITQVNEKDIPNHDILFAGFPCQPFSIIGQRHGFNDIRGTLFFDIARILKHKQPTAFVLENVKQLVGHDKGRTLKTIIKTLQELGYYVQYKVLNALDYGLPQKLRIAS
jgi:DNA (cytosine-5)-methyltransferase 1